MKEEHTFTYQMTDYYQLSQRSVEASIVMSRHWPRWLSAGQRRLVRRLGTAGRFLPEFPTA